MLLLLLSCFSRVRLCATPWTAAHQAPLSLGFSIKDEFNIERDYKLELEDLLDLVKSLKESDGETLNVIIDSSGVVDKPKTGLICNIGDLKFETGTNREYRRNPLRAIAKSEGMDLIDYRPWDRTKHGSLKGKHNNSYYLNNKKLRRK